MSRETDRWRQAIAEAREEGRRQGLAEAVAYLRHRAEVYQRMHAGEVLDDEADRLERTMDAARTAEGTQGSPEPRDGATGGETQREGT